VDDEPLGNGVYISSDGALYKGEWVKDKRKGSGEQINVDGTIERGVWDNDEPIRKE